MTITGPDTRSAAPGQAVVDAAMIDNYVGWLIPRLHGLDNPRYPSLVAVLIINTNLPVPSTWSRKAISTQPAS
jgi:hypothetical protein